MIPIGAVDGHQRTTPAGLSYRQIASHTGHSRNTIAKVLGEPFPHPFQATARPSCLDPFKPYLVQRWQAYRLRAPRLMVEVQAQGYTGSINLVQRFLKSLKGEQTIQAKATVHFETPPGQQAQADWAEFVRQETQKEIEKVYAFVMILSFSRMLYVEFTRRMDLPTLIACYPRAFAYFGGILGNVLYDYMTQVRLPGSRELHPLMADFAAHHGFAVRTHQVRRPRTKGKVERMVDYLKDNFLCGCSFAGLDDLQGQGRQWLEQTANVRVYATTGQRPCDLRASEGFTPLSGLRRYVLATALGVIACELGHRVYFTTVVELAWRLTMAMEQNCLHWELNRLKHPKLLIIDEVGYLTLSAAQSSLLFQAICQLYEKGQSIILTSNKAFSDWGKGFAGAAIMASAALDRLLHRCTVLNIRVTVAA